MNKIFFIIAFFLNLFCVKMILAQDMVITGRVVDSLHAGIFGASVQIHKANDSLRAGTDKEGNFRFPAVSPGNWKLTVRILGYESHTQTIRISAAKTTYALPLIVLNSKTQRLAEVQVNAPRPMRVAKDTVEYDASAFVVRPHDHLEDLLRQLPGLRIDALGNVTAMGESMYKLRVNGKDFFTNNVKDFLKQLPAGIIAKLQVIDDYGDQANFTGVKVGNSQKMLNLVIKEGQSKGVFGSLEASASTQGLWSAGLQGNVWLDVHQLSASANHSNTQTAEGKHRSTSAGTNYRYSADRVNYYGQYGYNSIKRTGESETYIESITSQGTLFNRIQQSTANKNQGQHLQLNLQSRGKKDFWNLQLSGQANTGTFESYNISKQTGVIVQDLDNTIQSESKNRTANVALSWSRNMAKQGRSLSASISASAQGGRETSTIQDQLRFYYQGSSDILKDSVNIRVLHEKKDLNHLAFRANYAEPLNDHATQITTRSLDFGYNFSLRYDQQQRETQLKQQDLLQRIDSLSNDYTAGFTTQQLDLSYRVASLKMQYSLGFRAQPALMRAIDHGQDKKVDYDMLNIFPIASMRYVPSLKNSIQINYSGTVSAPASNQLMPIKDVRNLQQISIGNPDLKPSKNHGVSVNVARVEPNKGQTYSLSLNGAWVQDQVTSNILLLPDTLGTLRQETHYVNVDGSYNLGTSYDMTLPFAKLYQLRWVTHLSTNHTMSYLDGIKGASKTLYFSQNLSVSFYKSKLRSTLNLNYNVTKNTYELKTDLRSFITTWEMSSDVHWTVFPWLILGADGNYQINKGYSSPIKNPILINAFVELYLAKGRELSIQLQGYDLLDQQQSVNFMVSSNAVTQRTFNRIGRYALLTAKYNLSRFGGK